MQTPTTAYCVRGEHNSCRGIVHYDDGQWRHDLEGKCHCHCHKTERQ